MIVLMRHGEAEHQAPSDALRPLSVRGRAEVQQSLDWLRQSVWPIQGIVASPYLRAQQTAHICAAGLGLSVTTEQALTPDSSPDRAESALREFEGYLVCFHQPILGRLVHRWSLQQPSVPTGAVFVLTGDWLAADWMTMEQTFCPQ